MTRTAEPEGKNTYYTMATIGPDDDKSTEHRPTKPQTERRTYPYVYQDGGTWKTVGPVSVTWTAPGGNTLETFTATVTLAGATPSGTECIYNANLKSRTAYL